MLENVIVELKAKHGVSDAERSQVIHYLKASGHRIGLLLNFGAESLDYRRFVFGPLPPTKESVKSA